MVKTDLSCPKKTAMQDILMVDLDELSNVEIVS